MLLFSARILADFTQQTIAVRRLPPALRTELKSSALAAPAHEDLGNRRSAELLLEWICRAQDVGEDGRVSAGFDSHTGWLEPAGVSTQLTALRFFIAAADLTGNGVYRRRARRIALAFVPEEPLPDELPPAALPSTAGVAEQAAHFQFRTAAQQLFGLGTYRDLLVSAPTLLKALGREAPIPDRLAVIRALFDLAWVTRDTRYADEGLELLDAIAHGDSESSAGFVQHEHDSGTDCAIRAELCETLLDGYRLSARNRLLHEAIRSLRPLLQRLAGDLGRSVAAARRSGWLSYRTRWNTSDLASVLRCLQGLRMLRHLRESEAVLERQLIETLRGSLLCTPGADLNGSLAYELPANGELRSVVRSTDAAATLGALIIGEEYRRKQSLSRPYSIDTLESLQ